MSDLNDEQRQELYSWIDNIPLSRQKKNITRDFSDGVLTAEVIHHFVPRLVDLHNYSPANATRQKAENWRLLNRKVFSRLQFVVPEDLLQGVVLGKDGVIEIILSSLRARIEDYVLAQKCNEEAFSPSHWNYQHILIDPSYQASPKLSWMQVQADVTSPHRPEHSQDSLTSRDNIDKTQSQPIAAASVQPTPSSPSSTNCSHISHIPLPNNRKHHHRPHLPPLGSNKPPVLTCQPTSKLLPPLVPQHSKPTATTRYGREALSTKTLSLGPSKLLRKESTSVKIRLAEKDQRLLQTQEYVQYLQMKVTRYEHLVVIKDMKIDELKRELAVAKNIRLTHLLQRPYQRR